MSHLIEARGLIKRFHGREVVKGLNMEIRENEVLALIGENGAGKSTTLLMLLGILAPDDGVIERWREDYRAHVGVQLQATPFFEGYSAEENLALFAALYKVRFTKQEIAKKLEQCGLQDARKTPAARLSLGQQKRLAIAVTTVHSPKLVVLDEPCSGLDPRARQEVRAMIRALAQNGVTVIFSSHDMEEVSRTASRIILLHEGGVAAQGSPDELLAAHGAQSLEDVYMKLTAIA